MRPFARLIKNCERSLPMWKSRDSSSENRMSSVCVRISAGSPATAYFAHLDNISRNIAIDDLRQVDAMIALRMRANGHSRKVVTDTINLCAPVIREYPSNSNWQGYAERTAEYAFGKVGDQDMARNQRFLPLWRKIEGIDERQGEEERSVWGMRSAAQRS